MTGVDLVGAGVGDTVRVRVIVVVFVSYTATLDHNVSLTFLMRFF